MIDTFQHYFAIFVQFLLFHHFDIVFGLIVAYYAFLTYYQGKDAKKKTQYQIKIYKQQLNVHREQLEILKELRDLLSTEEAIQRVEKHNKQRMDQFNSLHKMMPAKNASGKEWIKFLYTLHKDENMMELLKQFDHMPNTSMEDKQQTKHRDGYLDHNDDTSHNHDKS